MTLTQKRGQATLSFVLLVGGIVIEVAVASTFLSYVFSTSSRGERFALRALTAAHAGIQDAQLQIARNKEFVGLGSVTYSIPLSDAEVIVEVQKENQQEDYLYTITATGVASAQRRKLEAVLSVEKQSGLLRSQSLSEKPLL